MHVVDWEDLFSFKIECLRISNKCVISYLLENDISRPFRIS